VIGERALDMRENPRRSVRERCPARGRRATSDHKSDRLPVTGGQMPMTEGASLRSRVPQKWHARF
jgi:hypothetical protein